MKTKPMTHMVRVEITRYGRTRSVVRRARLTPKTVVTEVDERLPRDGTWRRGTAFCASKRIIPDTLHPCTVEELRGPLLSAVERLREDLTAAYTEMKEAKETVDSLLPELAAAEAALAEFDKRHGDKEDGA